MVCVVRCVPLEEKFALPADGEPSAREPRLGREAERGSSSPAGKADKSFVLSRCQIAPGIDRKGQSAVLPAGVTVVVAQGYGCMILLRNRQTNDPMGGFGAQGAEVRNMWMGGYLTKGNPSVCLGPSGGRVSIPRAIQRN